MPEGYALNWFAVILVAVVGMAAIGGMFLGNYLLAPKRPSAGKTSSYECGIEPAPFRWSQINIHYYVFAILFLIFDVEAVFLFPWAIIFLKSAPIVFYEMLIFIGILFFGVVYGWRKGVLQWK